MEKSTFDKQSSQDTCYNGCSGANCSSRWGASRSVCDNFSGTLWLAIHIDGALRGLLLIYTWGRALNVLRYSVPIPIACAPAAPATSATPAAPSCLPIAQLAPSFAAGRPAPPQHATAALLLSCLGDWRSIHVHGGSLLPGREIVQHPECRLRGDHAQVLLSTWHSCRHLLLEVTLQARLSGCGSCRRGLG